MCTAATYKTKDFYFGRTLDYEFSYGEETVITPRNFVFCSESGKRFIAGRAMIGIAHISENYPLYYDAVNEDGLCAAGLNFPGNAYYKKHDQKKENIAQFELIPWILSRCANIFEAKAELKKINITDEPFSETLPSAQLHWIFSDKNASLTVEAVKDGIKIYDNPVGILTNNPPFDMQMFALNNFMGVSPEEPENNFSRELELHAYSRGMGGLGLPGDLSSQSRFVRAAFVKMNSVSGNSENESVSQFFHILGSVEQQQGCCVLKSGEYEKTIYTSCCNADKGIYYYTTYNNHQITSVDMQREILDGESLIRYPLISDGQIKIQN